MLTTECPGCGHRVFTNSKCSHCGALVNSASTPVAPSVRKFEFFSKNAMLGILCAAVVLPWLYVVSHVGGGGNGGDKPTAEFTDSENAYDKTTDIKKLGWMRVGMDAVKAKLKDGQSAQFRNVFFFKGSDNIPVACGEVNSRNSFGGYSGFQKFISAGDEKLTYLQEEVEDFATAWNRLCR